MSTETETQTHPFQIGVEVIQDLGSSNNRYHDPKIDGLRLGHRRTVTAHAHNARKYGTGVGFPKIALSDLKGVRFLIDKRGDELMLCEVTSSYYRHGDIYRLVTPELLEQHKRAEHSRRVHRWAQLAAKALKVWAASSSVEERLTQAEKIVKIANMVSCLSGDAKEQR